MKTSELTSLFLVALMCSFALLISCNFTPTPGENQAETTNSSHVIYSFVTIDSCEYIATRTYSGYQTLAHKGNCKFCKNRNNGK